MPRQTLPASSCRRTEDEALISRREVSPNRLAGTARPSLPAWRAFAARVAGCARRSGRRAAAVVLLLSPCPAWTAPQKASDDLSALSLESLLDIEVTSVSRREQKVSQSASAIYVITQEDIRRSGATNIPDLLRMAPGVQVAQIDGNKWSVSIRGFKGRFSRRLLVMIDGRSVYHPAFAGVYWEANEVLLEDVDRIEVIRGPGATMWGSNAVNGVINVITKHSRQTQGGLVSGGGGNQEGGFGAARFGGEARENLHYRFYSKYFSRSGLLLDAGERANDNWLKLQGGVRIDFEPTPKDTFLLSSDAYSADAGDRQFLTLLEFPYVRDARYRASFSGVNVFARWTHDHSDRSHTQVQSYFDRSTRDDLFIRGTSMNSTDIEIQHQLDLARHRLVAGIGYRLNKDSHPVKWTASYVPRNRTTQRANMFLQDEVALLPGKLSLTLGSKFENNTFTDWEVQPSVSLLWHRSSNDTVWLSVARAARTPARVDRDVIFEAFAGPGPDGSVFLGEVFGSHDVMSEHLVAYEAGYRMAPSQRWSIDLAGFYHAHDGIVTNIEGTPFVLDGTPPVTVLPFYFSNQFDPRTYGAELAAAWKPVDRASLRMSYSWLQGGIQTASEVEGPGHQFHARWSWTLPHGIEWDSGYFFTDAHSGVPAYHRLDTRLAWRPSTRWEFSIVGQHLLDNQHIESPAVFAVPTEIGRGIYGKLTWRFGER